MNISLQKIFYQLLGKTNLQDVRIETLYELADSHPYFSPAQLFLTIKMQEEEHSGYQKQLQKTALYFNNLHWLNHQITTKPEFIHFIGQENEDIIEPILNNVIKEEIENSNKQNNQLTEEEILEELKEENPLISENKDLQNVEIQNTIEETQQSIASIALNEADKENSLITEQPIASTIKEEKEESIEEKVEENNISEVDNNLTEIIKKQLEEFKEPVSDDTEIVIENNPHHTVDYFESQGIKADVEFNAQDRLSNQLRKFTDWLKHIKSKSLEYKEDLGTDPELENIIQGIAQNSNETREIVTEAMAEVLEKQGKKDKAIQLYIKLSFLNPDKSTYFAAKIQHLKGL
ncbi:MAG: hypothetical protein LC122_01960 [Chitinophagales bacterium]|nr:hypothetical protein [Chitinophagales bacterium]